MLRKEHWWIFLLCFFSVLNILYMHYYILVSQDINPYTTHGGFEPISCFFNFCASLLEVTLVAVCMVAVALGNVKRGLLLTFVVTLIWSFANVVYSRFFQQYITLSAMTQMTALTDSFMIECVKSGLHWYDLLYVIWAFFFYRVYASCPSTLRVFGLGWLFLLNILSYALCFLVLALQFRFGTPRRYMNQYVARLSQTLYDGRIKTLQPTLSTFHRGSILSLDWASLFFKYELSAQQREQIRKEYQDYSGRKTRNVAEGQSDKNVIFIVVESYLSAVSDLKVDDKEITPFLNSIKHCSDVYYNGHVSPNVSIGESSDGQFIYMTGVLPLKSDITVTKVKHHTLISLPLILKELGVKESKMIIPTLPSMWEQTAMCETYGITHLYSCQDYTGKKGEELSDSEVFELAMSTDRNFENPFFSMILTIDMHSPYNKAVEHGLVLDDVTLPQAYKNYLISCHYTDMQIEKYFKHLQKSGLYDNSLIVIAADHDAHLDFLEMEGRITNEIPIYIVNGGIDSSTAWTGPCNQLDVFTTLLDVLGVKSGWHGLGHSLLFPTYQNSVSEKTWELSEWIIRGDYFKNESHFK